MTDLSNKVSIFVITTSKSSNYNDCIKALQDQNVHINILVIKDFHPMPVAFQRMIDKCNTPYYIQVDDDMILYPNAIETMYDQIIKSPDDISMIAFMLKDIHLNFNICGIKIYKHLIFKKYPYNLSCLSCEVEQTNRMKQDGYTYKTIEQVVGNHSPKWSDEGIFERYYNLMEKYKEFGYEWIKNIPLKLVDILKSNPSKQNLYAILGAYTSIIKDGIDNNEKDFTQNKKEFDKIKSFIEEPK